MEQVSGMCPCTAVHFIKLVVLVQLYSGTVQSYVSLHCKLCITSYFEIAIDVKMIIINHVLIQTKFLCVRCVENFFFLNNKHDELLTFHIKIAISKGYV